MHRLLLYIRMSSFRLRYFALMTSVVGYCRISHVSSDFGQLQSSDAETSVWKHVFRQAQFYQRICRTLVKLSDIHRVVEYEDMSRNLLSNVDMALSTEETTRLFTSFPQFKQQNGDKRMLRLADGFNRCFKHLYYNSLLLKLKSTLNLRTW